ncbi:MAG: hypothetical protein F6K58_02125 [Symploca sp. SIO2E9]|nr:hypothetical protein [Symploca sp. SIO2E9]
MAKGDGVLGKNRRWATLRVLFSFLITVFLSWTLVSCQDRIESDNLQVSETKVRSETGLSGQLVEVAPPPTIQKLNRSLDIYQPQVKLISPSTDEIIRDTTVDVQFQVQDLPIFQDSELGLGSHLEVILDNRPYTRVYDWEQPLILKDLEPGTHTLRVFACRPWYESFKNEGAYAQTTFHVFTKSADNNPDSTLPLLTYNSPVGSYGSQPILLDFYLTNAPLHLIATESPDDEIADWRIRVTVNGESFILDRWQSVYLKGFKSGKNWVQLEFIDDQGNPVNNVFNNTVRLINYEANGKDALSRLVRGELTFERVRSIVEPNYQAEPKATPIPVVPPEPEEILTPEPEETLTPEPEEILTPEPEEILTPEPEEILTPEPEEILTPEPEEILTPEPELPAEEENSAAESAIPSESSVPSEESTNGVQSALTEPLPAEKPESGNIFTRFFTRFRLPFLQSDAPASSPEASEEVQAPSLEPSLVPEPSEPPTEIAPVLEKSTTQSEAPVSVEEPLETAQETTPPESTLLPEPSELPALEQSTPPSPAAVSVEEPLEPAQETTPPESTLLPEPSELPALEELTPPSPAAVSVEEPLEPAQETTPSESTLLPEPSELPALEQSTPPSPAAVSVEEPLETAQETTPPESTLLPEPSELPALEQSTPPSPAAVSVEEPLEPAQETTPPESTLLPEPSELPALEQSTPPSPAPNPLG